MIALDTNILVYAHRSESGLHEEALSRVKELCEGSEPWALPIVCVSEFLRVTTHPRVFNPPSETAHALAFVAALVASPSCRLLRPGIRFLDHLFQAIASENARGNLVFDAQIVALCREHGVNQVLTNDRDFERFEDIMVTYLGAVHEPQALYKRQMTVQDYLSDT